MSVNINELFKRVSALPPPIEPYETMRIIIPPDNPVADYSPGTEACNKEESFISLIAKQYKSRGFNRGLVWELDI